MLLNKINKNFVVKIFKNPNSLNYNLFNFFFKRNIVDNNEGLLNSYHKLGYLKPDVDSKELANFLSQKIKDPNAKIIEEISNKYKLNYITLIHPFSYISNNVKIGKGTLVCAGAIIQTHSNIGDHCIINTNSSIDHHCNLDNFINVSPGCTLCSSIKINNLVFIGASTTIIPEVNIGSQSIIGAGSLVLKNIGNNMKCYGSPCKEICKT